MWTDVNLCETFIHSFVNKHLVNMSKRQSGYTYGSPYNKQQYRGSGFEYGGVNGSFAYGQSVSICEKKSISYSVKSYIVKK